MFQPVAGEAVIAVIQNDGSYALRAPAGAYRVGVTSLAEIPNEIDVWKLGTVLPPPPLPAKYQRPDDSGIAVEVAANDDNDIKILLPLHSR